MYFYNYVLLNPTFVPNKESLVTWTVLCHSRCLIFKISFELRLNRPSEMCTKVHRMSK